MRIKYPNTDLSSSSNNKSERSKHCSSTSLSSNAKPPWRRSSRPSFVCRYTWTFTYCICLNPGQEQQQRIFQQNEQMRLQYAQQQQQQQQQPPQGFYSPVQQHFSSMTPPPVVCDSVGRIDVMFTPKQQQHIAQPPPMAYNPQPVGFTPPTNYQQQQQPQQMQQPQYQMAPQPTVMIPQQLPPPQSQYGMPGLYGGYSVGSNTVPAAFQHTAQPPQSQQQQPAEGNLISLM